MYNLDHYTQQGHDWNLSPKLRDAMNQWLEYKEENGYPIKSYRSVEMIIKGLNDCCTRDSQKVTLIENAIAGGFPAIKYQTPIENGKQTGKRTGHNIDAIDSAADEVLRRHQMRHSNGGDFQ